MEPTSQRPDMDIEEDIRQLINSFPPLKASRPYFTFHSQQGRVVFTGNVRGAQARRVLVENTPRIQGVLGVDATNFYDDEMVRFAVGHMLPPGVFASVQYGAVALTGRLAGGVSAETILHAVEGVPGVRRVAADFGTVTEPSEGGK